MPSRTSKRKPKGRGSPKRPMEKPDLLPRKLHDLANALEAVSLARQFIKSRPEIRAALEQLAIGLGEARKSLHQMHAELHPAPPAKRHAAGR